MKKQIIIGLGLLIVGVLQAQETGNYLHFNVGGGIHNLSYNLNQNGTEKGQFGYTLNAGYSYFFTPQWGLQTGVGFQTFNSLSTLNYLSSTPDIDSDGQTYIFKANYKSWQEKQQALFVDIPLEIQYRLPINDKFGLLASGGANISFPVNVSFKSAGGQLVTTGFYSVWNVELSDMPQHGFSTYTNGFSGNMTLKPSYMAIGDIGGLYKLSEKLDLYIGGYINYGLNNVLKPDNKLIYQPIVPVSPDKNTGIYNGLFASNLTNNVIPISFGLKVGVYLRLGQKKTIPDLEKPIASIKSEQAIDTVKPNQPVDSIHAKPIEAVQPTDSIEPIQPIDSIPTVIQEKPVKQERDSLETAVIDKTPKVIEAPKEAAKASPIPTIVEQPTKSIVQENSVQNDDPFERAKKIAASMNLMFGFDSYHVIDNRNDKIKELSDILKANPYIHLRFVGHTCNIGTHHVNLILGMKRAINVKRKFIEQGVPKSQLISESKSYDQPLVPNTSKANRAKNRRVEIKVFMIEK